MTIAIDETMILEINCDDRIAISIEFDNVSRAMKAKKSAKLYMGNLKLTQIFPLIINHQKAQCFFESFITFLVVVWKKIMIDI